MTENTTHSPIIHSQPSLGTQGAATTTLSHTARAARPGQWTVRTGNEQRAPAEAASPYVTESTKIHSSFKSVQSATQLKDKNKIKKTIGEFLDNLSKLDGTGKAPELTREQRLHVYRNITYVKERSFDTERAELSLLTKEKERMNKQLGCMDRISAKSLTVFSSMGSPCLDDEIEQVKARYVKMRAAVEKYYSKFVFTKEEVESPAFQALTLEGHLPKRKYLMMFAEDLLQGAIDICENTRNVHRAKFYQECQQLCAAQALSLPQDIEKLSWEKIKQKILALNVPGIIEIIEKYDQIELHLNNFLAAIEEKRLFIIQDKRLGNNNPAEQLAQDESNWKKQMKDADQAIVEMAESLKAAYVKVGNATGEFSSAMKPEAQMKAAGATLTKARDAILNSKKRWSTPIDRAVQLPSDDTAGVGSSALPTLRHVMVCPNAGYASSAFRGRKDSESPIQPNWWNVQLQMQTGNGSRTVEFSRSAIQVEFMSEDPKKALLGDKDRMQATKRQVLEVLSEKAVKRFEKLPLKNGVGASKEKPLRLDITEVSLMTPDTVRSLLISDPKLGNLAKKISGWTTDISGWERRMMQENHDAWLFFDASNTTAWEEGAPKSFCYTCSNGDKREVIVHHEKEPEPKVVYEVIYTPVKGEKTNLFVQFDIAFYNAGCSERSKMMTHFATKEKITKKLELVCQTLADKMKSLPADASGSRASQGGMAEVMSKLSDAAVEFCKERSLKERRVASAPPAGNFLSLGLRKLKSAFLGGVQAFSQALVLERLQTLKHTFAVDPKASLSDLLEAVKASVVHLSSKELTAIAHAIPDEVFVEENIGLERLCEIGFPFIKTLLAHETGRYIIQVVLANLGKKITADELAGITLPDEFTSKLDKLLGDTNTIENNNNKKAFAKHQKRVQGKLTELEAQRIALQKELLRDSSTAALVQEIDQQVAWIKACRAELLKNEMAYAADKSEAAAQKRNLAFANWQTARNQLSCILRSELQVHQSKDMLNYLEIIRYEDNLIALHDEVSDLLAFQAFRDLKFMRKTMYCLSSKIMALSIYLDENPHTGCRSGKDRTALQDMEISTVFALEALKGRILNYREMEDDSLTLDVREALFLDSGQIDDLAFRNIGSYGLNLSGSYGSYLSGFRQLGKLWELPVSGGAWEAFRKNY